MEFSSRNVYFLPALQTLAIRDTILRYIERGGIIGYYVFDPRLAATASLSKMSGIF
jgi:hypothetical protein